MSGKIQVKTMFAHDSYAFARSVEEFLNSSVSELIDIEYSTCKSGYTTFHYALIVYR